MKSIVTTWETDGNGRAQPLFREISRKGEGWPGTRICRRVTHMFKISIALHSRAGNVRGRECVEEGGGGAGREGSVYQINATPSTNNFGFFVRTVGPEEILFCRLDRELGAAGDIACLWTCILGALVGRRLGQFA